MPNGRSYCFLSHDSKTEYAVLHRYGSECCYVGYSWYLNGNHGITYTSDEILFRDANEKVKNGTWALLPNDDERAKKMISEANAMRAYQYSPEYAEQEKKRAQAICSFASGLPGSRESKDAIAESMAFCSIQ